MPAYSIFKELKCYDLMKFTIFPLARWARRFIAISIRNPAHDPLFNSLSNDVYQIQMLPCAGVNCLNVTNSRGIELVLDDVGFEW